MASHEIPFTRTDFQMQLLGPQGNPQNLRELFVAAAGGAIASFEARFGLEVPLEGKDRAASAFQKMQRIEGYFFHVPRYLYQALREAQNAAEGADVKFFGVCILPWDREFIMADHIEAEAPPPDMPTARDLCC